MRRTPRVRRRTTRARRCTTRGAGRVQGAEPQPAEPRQDDRGAFVCGRTTKRWRRKVSPRRSILPSMPRRRSPVACSRAGLRLRRRCPPSQARRSGPARSDAPLLPPAPCERCLPADAHARPRGPSGLLPDAASAGDAELPPHLELGGAGGAVLHRQVVATARAEGDAAPLGEPATTVAAGGAGQGRGGGRARGSHLGPCWRCHGLAWRWGWLGWCGEGRDRWRLGRCWYWCGRRRCG